MRALATVLVVGAGLGAIGAAGTPALAQQAGPVTVFVVRHAEKGAEGADPGLTPAGHERARALAHALADAGIAAVFVSEFKRTQETAEPLAAALRLVPTRVDARQVSELVQRLKALPAGSRAVVVSHSNLVPAIVEQLSGIRVGELTDADYDRLYLVTVAPPGPATVLYLHYGAPAAAGQN